MPKLPAGQAKQSGTEKRFGRMKFANAVEAINTAKDDVALSPKQLYDGIDTFVPDATTTVKGKSELATDAEAIAKTATDKALVPSNLAALGSSATFAGLLEIATDAEAIAASATDKAIVPSNLAALTATNLAALSASDSDAQTKTSVAKYVTPGNLAASGFIQWADKTLTATEIKALATTPIELVAAPAAGSAHMFMGAMFKLNYGSEVFTEAADNLVIKYTDASGVAVSDIIECTGFIDQSADTITNAVAIKDAIVVATGAEAQALVLDNNNANFAGNASDDSTLTVRTYYVTHAL
jgi:hypothetical protein